MNKIEDNVKKIEMEKIILNLEMFNIFFPKNTLEKSTNIFEDTVNFIIDNCLKFIGTNDNAKKNIKKNIINELNSYFLTDNDKANNIESVFDKFSKNFSVSFLPKILYIIDIQTKKYNNNQITEFINNLREKIDIIYEEFLCELKKVLKDSFAEFKEYTKKLQKYSEFINNYKQKINEFIHRQIRPTDNNIANNDVNTQIDKTNEEKNKKEFEEIYSFYIKEYLNNYLKFSANFSKDETKLFGDYNKMIKSVLNNSYITNINKISLILKSIKVFLSDFDNISYATEEQKDLINILSEFLADYLCKNDINNYEESKPISTCLTFLGDFCNNLILNKIKDNKKFISNVKNIKKNNDETKNKNKKQSNGEKLLGKILQTIFTGNKIYEEEHYSVKQKSNQNVDYKNTSFCELSGYYQDIDFYFVDNNTTYNIEFDGDRFHRVGGFKMLNSNKNNDNIDKDTLIRNKLKNLITKNIQKKQILNNITNFKMNIIDFTNTLFGKFKIDKEINIFDDLLKTIMVIDDEEKLYLVDRIWTEEDKKLYLDKAKIDYVNKLIQTQKMVFDDENKKTEFIKKILTKDKEEDILKKAKFNFIQNFFTKYKNNNVFSEEKIKIVNNLLANDLSKHFTNEEKFKAFSYFVTSVLTGEYNYNSNFTSKENLCYGLIFIYVSKIIPNIDDNEKKEKILRKIKIYINDFDTISKKNITVHVIVDDYKLDTIKILYDELVKKINEKHNQKSNQKPNQKHLKSSQIHNQKLITKLKKDTFKQILQ